MPTKKSADQWFADYGESHQDHTNELIHWICVPLIFFSVLGFLWSLPLPDALVEAVPWFNWSLVAIAAATVFYVRLSPPLSAGLLFFMSLCYVLLVVLELFAPWPVWQICAMIFVLAWLGQFIGHKIEGKKPSFFQDLAFLLIGPAWLMSMVYKKLGQKYRFDDCHKKHRKHKNQPLFFAPFVANLSWPNLYRRLEHRDLDSG